MLGRIIWIYEPYLFVLPYCWSRSIQAGERRITLAAPRTYYGERERNEKSTPSHLTNAGDGDPIENTEIVEIVEIAEMKYVYLF